MSTALDTEFELAPFGWYPDPAGSDKLRWWDGHKWTTDLERPRPEIRPAYGYNADGTIAQQFDY
ncbi:MAG: DUF2510 domain-containing protein [Rhodoglobus sp.]